MVCCSPAPHDGYLPADREDRNKGEIAYLYKLCSDIYFISRSGNHIAAEKRKNALLPDPQLVSDHDCFDARVSAGQQTTRERRRIERCKFHSVRYSMRLCF